MIIDAALSLQERGHHVEVFTSFHEDGDGGRSFEETRDGEFAFVFFAFVFLGSSAASAWWVLWSGGGGGGTAERETTEQGSAGGATHVTQRVFVRARTETTHGSQHDRKQQKLGLVRPTLNCSLFLRPCLSASCAVSDRSGRCGMEPKVHKAGG